MTVSDCLWMVVRTHGIDVLEVGMLPLAVTPSRWLADRPMLPQETMDAIILQVRDKKTLKACALSARPLRWAAQRRLFETVIVRCTDISKDEKENLGRLLECYSSADMAKHARNLCLSASHNLASSFTPDSRLLDLVSKLASQNHESVGLGSAFWKGPRPSLMYGLVIQRVPLTIDDLLRIVWAFPNLCVLGLYHCLRNNISESEQRGEVSPWKYIPPPKLHQLVFGGVISVAPMLAALFPTDEPVYLEALSFSGNSRDSAFLLSAIKRAKGLRRLVILPPWRDPHGAY